MGEVEGGCMSGGGEVKRKEGEYVGGGEKNGKKKEKRNAEVWYVGGGEKKKREGGEGERGRIYNGNRGRERKKMRKESILGVAKKINK
jgi:hypothetical protein